MTAIIQAFVQVIVQVLMLTLIQAIDEHYNTDSIQILKSAYRSGFVQLSVLMHQTPNPKPILKNARFGLLKKPQLAIDTVLTNGIQNIKSAELISVSRFGRCFDRMLPGITTQIKVRAGGIFRVATPYPESPDSNSEEALSTRTNPFDDEISPFTTVFNHSIPDFISPATQSQLDRFSPCPSLNRKPIYSYNWTDFYDADTPASSPASSLPTDSPSVYSEYTELSSPQEGSRTTKSSYSYTRSEAQYLASAGHSQERFEVSPASASSVASSIRFFRFPSLSPTSESELRDFHNQISPAQGFPHSRSTRMANLLMKMVDPIDTQADLLTVSSYSSPWTALSNSRTAKDHLYLAERMWHMNVGERNNLVDVYADNSRHGPFVHNMNIALSQPWRRTKTIPKVNEARRYSSVQVVSIEPEIQVNGTNAVQAMSDLKWIETLDRAQNIRNRLSSTLVQPRTPFQRASSSRCEDSVDYARSSAQLPPISENLPSPVSPLTVPVSLSPAPVLPTRRKITTSTISYKLHYCPVHSTKRNANRSSVLSPGAVLGPPRYPRRWMFAGRPGAS